jgi:hypothetical protein
MHKGSTCQHPALAAGRHLVAHVEGLVRSAPGSRQRWRDRSENLGKSRRELRDRHSTNREDADPEVCLHVRRPTPAGDRVLEHRPARSNEPGFRPSTSHRDQHLSPQHAGQQDYSFNCAPTIPVAYAPRFLSSIATCDARLWCQSITTSLHALKSHEWNFLLVHVCCAECSRHPHKQENLRTSGGDSRPTCGPMGEALIQQPDRLIVCEGWNERMWIDGEPVDPSHP